MVAGVPWQGGATCAVLQYRSGLRELGHEVLLVDSVPAGALDREEVMAYFRLLGLRHGQAAIVEHETERAIGQSRAEVQRFAGEADLLINLAGTLRDRRLVEAIDTRLFVDLDPGFTQVWHEQGHDLGLDLHTDFASVGGLLGAAGSPVPTCGRDWITTLPPVSLPRWPLSSDPPNHDAFTTVGHWRSYGSIEHEGIHYGQRAHSFRELIELPRDSRAHFKIALGIHPDERADLRALAANGWELLDPTRAAGTPKRYRDFVGGSKAEICIAKSGYVNSRCGWFSDRSACYLASGRPVVAQDTGFGESLPTGEGLLAFANSGQAAEAIAEVEANTARHRRAARAIAEEHLDARKVLSGLIDRLAASPHRLSARKP